jgi:general secretion pathway protein F
MAVYAYSAVDLDASTSDGTVAADTPRQARDLLRERGLSVTRIWTLADRSRGSRSAFRRTQPAEVTVFLDELATLLGAGIPLLAALQTLSDQHSKRFRAVIQHMADQVAAGISLAEAMRQRPECFDELCVSIVHVGESTGQLEISLAQLAQFKAKAHRLRSQVTTALIYPAIVSVIGLAVTVLLMTYVVPNLLEALTQAGQPLPAVTMVVKAASDFLIEWWWALLLCALGGALTARLLLRAESPQRRWDRIKLATPLLGELIRKELTARMAVVLAALLRSGIPFADAVRITRQTLRNWLFRDALEKYEAAVVAGRDVAGPLRESGVFRPMVIQMLSVGQQAGQLEDMLEKLADSYERQVDLATRRLTSLLEPLLIVLLAIVVGFVAFAAILPILEASNVH